MKLAWVALVACTVACGNVDETTEPTAPACGEPVQSADLIVPEHDRPRPELGAWHTDPALGGCIARVTDHDATPDVPALWASPNRQAWNSNGSRILLGTGHVLDSARFTTLSTVPPPAVWDPVEPNLLYRIARNQLLALELETGTERVVASFPEYSELDAKRLGDVSAHGRRIALVGIRAADHVPEVFVWDLAKGTKSPALPAPVDFVNRAIPPRWAAASPSGNGVVVAWPDAGTGAFHGIELYDSALHLERQLSPDTGDADVTLDADGTEWLIDEGEGEAGPVVKKTSLGSGVTKRLLELEWFHNVRISCRAPGSGVCVLSTQGDPSGEWRAFENEVFVLSLDSTPDSPLVSRLVHHHSAPDFVSSQSPSACSLSPDSVLSSPTSSRDGRVALFTSNWSSHCFGELYLIQR